MIREVATWRVIKIITEYPRIQEAKTQSANLLHFLIISFMASSFVTFIKNILLHMNSNFVFNNLENKYTLLFQIPYLINYVFLIFLTLCWIVFSIFVIFLNGHILSWILPCSVVLFNFIYFIYSEWNYKHLWFSKDEFLDFSRL